MTEFKIGDVVKLKSSNYLGMTVSAINQGFAKNEVQCVWFDEDEHIQSWTFRKETLEKVESHFKD